MSKPNLFIVGAPKCGTTSLADWLSQHPEVHVSPIKEPHFLNTDQNYHHVTSYSNYLSLFKTKRKDIKVFCEASVFYLYSRAAIKSIRLNYPESKIIVCIRNPVEMIRSFYGEQRFWGFENISDFNAMWAFHDQRINCRLLPSKCPEPLLLDYKKVCNLGDALEILFNEIPCERAKVVTLDEIGSSPDETYAQICEFLEINVDFVPNFVRQNSAKERRFPLIYDGLRQINRFIRKFGFKGGTGAFKFINRFLLRSSRSIEIKYEVNSEVKSFFAPQIIKLESILKKDLSHWKY